MPGQKRIGWADLRVGMLVLASIATLVLLILAVSGDISFFKDKMTLKTDLVAAEGLKRGDEVRLAGVTIGSIESVDFGAIPESPKATSAVVVTMSVDGDVARERIRTDSRAMLRSLGLLGGQYVNITPGTREADPVRDGDTIRGLQETTITEVVEQSEDLLAGFKQLTGKLNEITEVVSRGDGTIGRFIYDEAFYVNLTRVTREAESLVQEIREGEGTAGRLINDPRLYEDMRGAVNSLQSVVEQVANGKGSVGRLINEEQLYNNLDNAVARINTASERAERIIAQVETGKGTINRLLYDDKVYQETTATLASIRTVAERLERGEGAAGKLLKDDALYDNLNQLSAESVKLIYDFRQNPKKYLSIKVSLF
jgi:phospholipid/cholesterol/gamma-HCH transport system substrate-binding protein